MRTVLELEKNMPIYIRELVDIAQQVNWDRRELISEMLKCWDELYNEKEWNQTCQQLEVPVLK